MTIRHMRIFLKVCEMGNSVTGAAGALYMTQPSVSQALREMEENYGVKLFDRLSRRLCLTAAGEEMRVYAQRIIALYEDADKAMRAWNSRGSLRIGASMTIGACLMPALAEQFRKENGEDSLKILVDTSRALTGKLRTNALDLVLAETPEYDGMLRAEKFFSDELIPIVPRMEPYRDGMLLSPEDLLRFGVILREKGSGTRDIFDRVTREHGFSAEPVWETASTMALISAVSHGIGVSVVPRVMAREAAARGEVWLAQIGDIRFPQDFYMVVHRDKYLTGAALRFMELVRRSAASFLYGGRGN